MSTLNCLSNKIHDCDWSVRVTPPSQPIRRCSASDSFLLLFASNTISSLCSVFHHSGLANCCRHAMFPLAANVHISVAERTVVNVVSFCRVQALKCPGSYVLRDKFVTDGLGRGIRHCLLRTSGKRRLPMMRR